MNYVVWAAFLFAQTAAFTFNSRARNSSSYMMHACSALCSNAIFISSQFVSLTILLDAIKSGSWKQRAFVAAFYTTFTVMGGLVMHWVSLNIIEKKKA